MWVGRPGGGQRACCCAAAASSACCPSPLPPPADTMAKSLAERLLVERVQRDGLPLAIVRPTLVCGLSLHHPTPGYVGNPSGAGRPAAWQGLLRTGGAEPSKHSGASSNCRPRRRRRMRPHVGIASLVIGVAIRMCSVLGHRHSSVVDAIPGCATAVAPRARWPPALIANRQAPQCPGRASPVPPPYAAATMCLRPSCWQRPRCCWHRPAGSPARRASCTPAPAAPTPCRAARCTRWRRPRRWPSRRRSSCSPARRLTTPGARQVRWAQLAARGWAARHVLLRQLSGLLANPGGRCASRCAGLKFKLRMHVAGRRVAMVTLALTLIGQRAAARKLQMGWKVGCMEQACTAWGMVVRKGSCVQLGPPCCAAWVCAGLQGGLVTPPGLQPYL